MLGYEKQRATFCMNYNFWWLGNITSAAVEKVANKYMERCRSHVKVRDLEINNTKTEYVGYGDEE